jgi:hypothetical protein
MYNFDDKLECYTISADGINFVGFEGCKEFDLDDYDYTLDETYYPTDFNEVSLEVNGSMSNGKTIRNWMNAFKNKEDKEMNKVLELYYERRINKLGEFYKELKEQKYNELEVVKEFNKVVEEYNKKMQELMGKYKDEENNMSLIHKTGYNEYPYVLSSNVKNEIYTSLTKRYEEDKKALLAEKETIAAVLSLSEDKDYQVEVLKNYGILDKKGMMVEDDE